MDLRHIYPGAYPRDVELAQPQRNALMAVHGLAKDLIEGRLDDPTNYAGMSVNTLPVYVAGFEPVYMGNLTLKLCAGRIYKIGPLDDQSFSNMAADSSEVMQQYTSQDILLQANTALDDNNPVTLFGGFTAPATGANKYRIQVCPVKHDGTVQTLNFYNAAQPDNPNQVQVNVDRRFHVHFGVTVTSDGSEPPSLGADWISLYLVTINAGNTFIQQSNVTLYNTAPLLSGLRALLSRFEWLRELCLTTVDYVITEHVSISVPNATTLPPGTRVLLVAQNAGTIGSGHRDNGIYVVNQDRSLSRSSDKMRSGMIVRVVRSGDFNDDPLLGSVWSLYNNSPVGTLMASSATKAWINSAYYAVDSARLAGLTLAEVQAPHNDHVAAGSNAHAASAISFTPDNNYVKTATNVQAAIVEAANKSYQKAFSDARNALALVSKSVGAQSIPTGMSSDPNTVSWTEISFGNTIAFQGMTREALHIRVRKSGLFWIAAALTARMPNTGAAILRAAITVHHSGQLPDLNDSNHGGTIVASRDIGFDSTNPPQRVQVFSSVVWLWGNDIVTVVAKGYGATNASTYLEVMDSSDIFATHLLIAELATV